MFGLCALFAQPVKILHTLCLSVISKDPGLRNLHSLPPFIGSSGVASASLNLDDIERLEVLLHIMD